VVHVEAAVSEPALIDVMDCKRSDVAIADVLKDRMGARDLELQPSSTLLITTEDYRRGRICN
jgi:hypothetical protein